MSFNFPSTFSFVLYSVAGRLFVPCLLLLAILLPGGATGQSVLEVNANFLTYTGINAHKDLLIPDDVILNDNSYLELEIRGADGGRGKTDGCYVDGGEGANIEIRFRVGTGTADLRPGGIVRIIAGRRGQVGKDYFGVGGGGGGGGSAVLYTHAADTSAFTEADFSEDLSEAGDKWVLLAVAGGGGGGKAVQVIFCTSPKIGKAANATTEGDGRGLPFGADDLVPATDGAGGQYYGFNNKYGFAGAGIYGNPTQAGDSDDFGTFQTERLGRYARFTGTHPIAETTYSYGYPSGGARGADGDFEGAGLGGGGGGYSGGAGAGCGAGSWANPVHYTSNIQANGQTNSPADGYVRYRLLADQPPVARCTNRIEYVFDGTPITDRPDVDDIDDGSFSPQGYDLTYALDVDPDAALAFGTQLVTLTVTDEIGISSSCQTLLALRTNTSSLTQLAVTDANVHLEFTDDYEQFKIPANPTINAIRLQLNGGDGGNAVTPVFGFCDRKEYDGGRAARVAVTFEIGCADDVLQPGGLLRFIVGEAGDSDSQGNNPFCTAWAAGGGGGGTGVVYLPPGGERWEVLLVAGGGGGARAQNNGYDGRDGIIADQFLYDLRGGAGGDTNTDGNANFGAAGGGAYSDGEDLSDCSHGGGHAGGSEGGSGGSGSDCGLNDVRAGGYGFGGGGSGLTDGGGGGGSYGGNDRGFGGGSYINPGYQHDAVFLKIDGTVGEPEDGYAIYRVSNNVNNTLTGNCLSTTVILDDVYSERDLAAHELINVTGSCEKYYASFASGITTLSLDCADIGTSSHFIQISDLYGNAANCFATVTVTERKVPSALCRPVEIAVANVGTSTLTAADLLIEATDNCSSAGQLSYALSRTDFDCGDVDNPVVVTLTVTDGEGNSFDCLSEVIAVESASAPCCPAPALICHSDTLLVSGTDTVYIRTSDLYTEILGDDCQSFSLTASPNFITEADLGLVPVSITSTDALGRSATCSATLTVLNGTASPVTCNAVSATVELGETVTMADISGIVFGPDGTESFSPATLDCSSLGSNTVAYTYVEPDGTEWNCNAVVTLNLAGNCMETPVYEFAGQGTETIDPFQLIGGANCGSTDGLTVATPTVDCADFVNDYSLVFDQAGASVSFPHSDIFQASGPTWMGIDLLIKPDVNQPTDADWYPLVGKVDPVSGATFLVVMYSDFTLGYRSTAVGGEILERRTLRALVPGEWQYLGFYFRVHEQGAILMWIDDTRVLSYLADSPVQECVRHDAPITFGAYEGYTGQGFRGAIDDLRIRNTALQDNQRRNYQDVGMRGDEAGISIYATFEEGPGATVANNMSIGDYRGTYTNVSWTATDMPVMTEAVREYPLAITDANGTGACTGAVTVRMATDNNCAQILPLDLLSFTGRTEGKRNALSWTTANEVDFSHFELERSAEGVGEWTALVEVPGAAAGTNNVERSYDWTDETPLLAAYYRLRSVDLDGTFSLSEVVYLERTDAGEMIVYPNPTTGHLTVSLPSNEPATVELYDLNGKLLQTAVTSGGTLEQRLGVPAGVYLLVATSAGERWTRRVVVR